MSMTWDDIQAEIRSDQERLEWLEEKRRTHHYLDDLYDELPEGTIIPSYNDLGRSENGMISITLIFPERVQMTRFRRKYHGTWIIADDRSCFMKHENSWTDRQGTGLMLSITDYPLTALDYQRNSDLRNDYYWRRDRRWLLNGVR